jgi:chromosome segregation ATPase
VAKQLQHQLNEVQGKLDETNRTLNDFDAAKKKLSIENSDLLRQLEEAESQVSQLSKLKISLTTQLEDTKRLADEESRVSPFAERFVLRNELLFYDKCADSLTVRGVFGRFVKRWMFCQLNYCGKNF